MSVLAIDAGTTGVTALVVTDDGRIAARGYQEFAQHFPQPGWVEHAPEEIWQATLAAAARRAGAGTTPPSSTRGRHHQPARDRPALGPRDPRLAAARDRLAGPAHRRHLRPAARRRATRTRVTELTGLRLDPYFSGTKLTWLAEHEPHTWALRRVGRGTPSAPSTPTSIARMTRGTCARHRRRPTPSRTLLLDLATGAWSDELCDAVRRTRATRCPRWCRTGARSARTDPDVVPRPRPADRRDRRRPAGGAVRADLLRRRATRKCTYGTGSFVLTNTGTDARCAPTPACSRRSPGARPTAS